ncbi:ABC transporter substrate-binding protein [Paenibacillus swuensis]|uniref:Putative aliphatic sulfonates-binding protein n=1 Tax=Paenibacillus swuensis TaxID=1178515 RepID=A0A172TJ21_9BACL|nr:sulfonate ABC transporter substrate-binding protein [Paenibacillus swuensis]ANE46894.1 ABC transporter substrate-binding protein [Paenibacillus swuensis]
MKLRKGIMLLVSVVLLSGILSGCNTNTNVETANNKVNNQTEANGEKASKTKDITVRIGYQKYGTINILKADGALDKRLEESNIKIEWTEFPGGPQLLEALNVGSLDIGHTGEAPPIFAQAAGAPLVYLAHEPASPASEGILVHKDSAIATVADLKGKKVALNKGSNVHYLLVKQLEKAGVAYKDIQVEFLPPADARAAFEKGSVDAWIIWDPFLAAAQTATGAKILADGKDVVNNHEFYLAERSFAEKYPDVIDALLEEADKIDTWSKDHPKELAEKLAPILGIDVASLELAAGRRQYGVQPIDAELIQAQQQIADTFRSLELIPKDIKVEDAVLKEE